METYQKYRWSIALLLLVTFAGCGQDANSGKQALQEDYNLPDTAVVMPVSPAEPEAITTPAPSAATPTSNILENIRRSDSLTMFWAMLKKADMTKDLSGTGPYTVFAPSDLALQARYGKSVADLLKPEQKARLQELVSTHLIAGKLSIADMEDGATLITAGGQQLKVAKKQGKVRINDALVAAADADCRNGVVHVVDKVLEAEAQPQ